MKHWPPELKNQIIKAREAGAGYTEIVRRFGVPKSTFHLWISHVPKPPQYIGEQRKKWWKKMQKLAVAANKKKNENINQEMEEKIRAEVEAIQINGLNLKALLAMLYWAEGWKGKHAIISFANTDPKLALLFITLLRKCFHIDETKIRVRMHLHDYHNENLVKKFWSNLLNVPLNQFGKVYWKQRSKEKTFRKNFGGICFIKYNSVYLQRELVDYALNLGEKIVGKVNITLSP